ncbi:hypothetical protein HanIR_Chr05g0238901 [Helianthus annuus]|nr:hypothetical protein HanIR_Chr05g0238901 [Helianthus annuus]
MEKLTVCYVQGKLKSLERMIRECSLRWMLRQLRMRMDRRTPGKHEWKEV